MTSPDRYAMICHYLTSYGTPKIEITRWPTRADAVAARDMAPRCSDRCQGVHTVAFVPVEQVPARHPSVRAHARHADQNSTT